MTSHYVYGILVAAAVTFGLRYAAFVFAERSHESPLLTGIRPYLPAGTMLCLALYAIYELAKNGHAAAALIASLVTVLAHLARRNVLLSIVAGIAAFGLLRAMGL